MSEREIPQEYLDYWRKRLEENPPGPLPAEIQAQVTALLSSGPRKRRVPSPQAEAQDEQEGDTKK